MKTKFLQGGVAIVAILMMLWLLSSPTSTDNDPSEDQAGRVVSVIHVTPQTRIISIDVTGVVQPRWQVQLTANVRGKLTHSFDTLLPGIIVKKGQPLALVEQQEYQALLSRAQADEASAALELARVLNEQSVAKRINSGTNNSDYRLLKPHVEAAKAALQAAKDNVTAVQKQLDDTQVLAPFDAVILQKSIVPAQQINLGDPLYTLASSKATDIAVSVSNTQWQKGQITRESIAQIADGSGLQTHASVRFIAPALNAQTRQHAVMLSVGEADAANQRLFPEQQVDVSFATPPIANTVEAPATALTRDSFVWVVVNNTLKLERISLIEENSDTVTFQFIEDPALARDLVRYPLSTMIEGQTVTPEFLVNEGGAL